MNLKLGVKIHNRFDIEVRDIKTGNVKKAYAENMVLDSAYAYLCSNNVSPLNYYIYFGHGSGTVIPTRTTLFSQIGYKLASIVETALNLPPEASYCKKKIVIAPEEYVGETITEVGNSNSTSSQILTHALLKDSEGNQISIGPKTDTQEITIYSTVYAQVTCSDGILLTLSEYGNELLHKLTGAQSTYFHTGSISSLGIEINFSSDKSPTNQSTNYSSGNLLEVPCPFNVYDVPNRKQSTPRIRLGTSQSNGKIWSIALTRNGSTGATRFGILRMLFPNEVWQGYNFLNELIETGDGITATFNLPWSDINTTKAHTIYVNDLAKTEDLDYTLSNSESDTSITFTPGNIPADGDIITGDWWVDYIPKDDQHVIDITLTIQFGEQT